MFLLIGCWGSTTKTMSRDYASMKLVLMLTTGAVFALLGLLAMYMRVEPRTFDMVALERFARTTGFDRSFQMVWFPPIFLGFAALVPMWPLHSWSPGGHAAAPAAVSMLHAGVLMKLGAYGILRVAVTYMPDAAAVYLPWVGALCCFNIIYGGLVAMAQRDMKFVVGYSSSSHMGYVLLGIATTNLIGHRGRGLPHVRPRRHDGARLLADRLLLRADPHAHARRPRRADEAHALHRHALHDHDDGLGRPARASRTS